MIETSPCTVLKADYSTESNKALIENIQKVYGETLKSSVFITDIQGILITEGYILPPFRKNEQDKGKLWKCCCNTIQTICKDEDEESTQSQQHCECGHEITSTKLRLIGDDIIRIITIRLTEDAGNHDVVIKAAINNGYSLDEAAEAYSHAAVSKKEIYHMTSEMLKQQATLFNTLLSNSIIVNQHQELEERSRTEKELIRAKEEAEESSRLKSSLLANMSHELRTPMTGILGFSEILHEELEDPRYKNMALTIYKSATRLMTTLNTIMDLSAIESNKTVLNLKPVNVKNTILALLKNVYPMANDKGLYIRTSLSPHIYAIADEKLLNQLLHHLIDNAIKFTTDGGLSISAYAGLLENTDVVIKISDTGIGIDPQHHKLIFEEFRQVSEGLSRTFEGSGLGLSLVMKIAKLIKGKVWVESEQGKGSDFYISLPLASVMVEDESLVTEQPAPISTLRLGRGNVPEVLIVEDNEVNRRLAALYLREICNIDMAENGYIALEKIKDKKYDAILMDINLGAGPNGIHVAQEIKTYEKYHDVPIIAVTGYTMQGDREKLLSNGCSHYVAKPYDKRTLIKLFSKLLYQSA